MNLALSFPYDQEMHQAFGTWVSDNRKHKYMCSKKKFLNWSGSQKLKNRQIQQKWVEKIRVKGLWKRVSCLGNSRRVNSNPNLLVYTSSPVTLCDQKRLGRTGHPLGWRSFLGVPLQRHTWHLLHGPLTPSSTCWTGCISRRVEGLLSLGAWGHCRSPAAWGCQGQSTRTHVPEAGEGRPARHRAPGAEWRTMESHRAAVPPPWHDTQKRLGFCFLFF